MYKKVLLFTTGLFIVTFGRSQPVLLNDFKKAYITLEGGANLCIMNVVGQFVFFSAVVRTGRL